VFIIFEHRFCDEQNKIWKLEKFFLSLHCKRKTKVKQIKKAL